MNDGHIFSDRIGWIMWIFLLLSHLPDEGKKTQSRQKAGRRKGKKYLDYPVNLVSSKLI